MTSDQKKTNEQWREQLTDEQYHVTREAGTERPFTGVYYDTVADGAYRCVCCKTELFSSDTKYDSGSGWPSFTDPTTLDSVTTHEDRSLGHLRTEVRCAACDAHLGHVFEDGPGESGKRYCINSAALHLDRSDD